MIFGYGDIRTLRPVRKPLLRLLSTSDNGRSSQASKTSVLSSKVRTLMRATPHPLTAIVALSPKLANSSGKSGQRACGLLVSSFNTVTLYPKPFVSFNIKRPSSTYDAICEAGSFIASGISSPAVANAFVNRHDATAVWQQMIAEDGRLFDGVGGTWWMMCGLAKEHGADVGDHTIVVGEVLDAASYGADRTKTGLVYVDGTYRKVGDEQTDQNDEQSQAPAH